MNFKLGGKKFSLVFPENQDYFILIDEANNNRCKFASSYLHKPLIELVEDFEKTVEYLEKEY